MAEHLPLPESFLPLHPVDFRILLILTERKAHGYRIVQEIEAWMAATGTWSASATETAARMLYRL